MSDQRLTVEEFVDGAIIEGFQRGSQSFLESIETSIRNNTLIQEAADAESYLQEMIDHQQQEVSTTIAQESFSNLSQKLGSVLNR